MLYDWVNPESIPASILPILEGYMSEILLLDPEKDSVFFDSKSKKVEVGDTFSFRIPSGLRRQIS